MIKSIYEKFTANAICSDERLNDFPLILAARQEYLLSLILFGIIIRHHTKKVRLKSYRLGKKVKLYLLTENMTFHVGNPSSVQLLSCVWLSVTPWTAAHQASLSITNSWSLLKFMSIELVMPSNHLILCHPLLLLPSIFPSKCKKHYWENLRET